MAFFRDSSRNDDGGVVSFGPYKPWSWHKAEGGNSTNYPSYSGKILDFKEGKDNAIEYFYTLVEPELGNDFAIAIVPPHDPDKESPALKRLAQRLAASGSRTDASVCLVRMEKIAKLAGGGNRSVDVHLRTIAVVRPDLIRGRDVLVLDDVTTSGNSLTACQRLLLDAGAARVQPIALGST